MIFWLCIYSSVKINQRYSKCNIGFKAILSQYAYYITIENINKKIHQQNIYWYFFNSSSIELNKICS